MKIHAIGAGLYVLALTCAAQVRSIEAPRYVNGQGIEVIQGRMPPAALPPAEKAQQPASTSGSVTTPQAARGIRAASAGGGAASDPRMHVSAAEQQSRDEDRLAILNDELKREMGEYATKTKILNSPSMRDKLPPAEVERLRELAVTHEKNIQALMSEIAGVHK